MSNRAKIGVLLPRDSFLEQIDKVLKEEPEFKDELVGVTICNTADSLEEARRLIDKGASIIVARGLQAEILKQYTNVPVVEVVTTTQEIGIMIRKAKEQIKKEHPTIGMVTFQKSVGDTTYINEIFNVDFHVYCAASMDELDTLVRQAAGDGADIIIGGDKVGKIVEHYKIPYLFAVSTEDSIRNAFEIARKMNFAADVERTHNAQMETILDSTFNGVIRIDRNKKILLVNRMMEELISKKSSDVTGSSIEALIALDGDYVDRVLDGRQESCLTSAKVRDIPIMVMIAPIKIDDDITGAIVSCHKLKNVVSQRNRTIQEMYLSGFFAKSEFEYIYSKDRCTKEAIELAKKYALSRFPVLLVGEDEAECKTFAQSIHNNSLRKNSPFVSVSCAHLSEEEQLEKLFGKGNSSERREEGILEIAKYGTVYIRDIDCMGEKCQYKIFRVVSNRLEGYGDADKIPHHDIRLIAGTGKNLRQLVDQGLFRKDLYYAISALTLKIPSLRERPMDVEHLVTQYLDNFKENYSRYLTISEGAMQILRNYDWSGGVVQLEAFCERLFLSASRKNIDPELVERLLEEVYRKDRSETFEDSIDYRYDYRNNNRNNHRSDNRIHYRSEDGNWQEGEEFPLSGKETYLTESEKHQNVISEAEQLALLLRKYAGSRSKVAKELGISTTTLWRRMKKYGL